MALPKQDSIKDQDRIRDYRTELPNIIDDFGLSVYAHRLYSHYKRACGPAGACDQGARYIAGQCGMSTGKTTDAKKELVEEGLIWIEEAHSSNGVMDSVTLPDLWEWNFQIYFIKDDPVKRQLVIDAMKCSLREHPLACSSRELLRSRGELLRSRREQKKEHLKKEHLKNLIVDTSEDDALPEPASQVPATQSSDPEIPIPTPIPGEGKLTVIEVALEIPITPVAPPPLPLPPSTPGQVLPPLDTPYAWLVSSGEGTLAHIGKSATGRTLCGEGVKHRESLNSPIGPRDPCGDCQGLYQTALAAALEAAQKPKYQRPPKPTDPLFDAIGLHVLSARTKADVEAVGWRINQIINGDKKNKRTAGLIAYEQERQGKEDLDFPALARDVKSMWDWYQAAHPNYELKDCGKFMEQWVAWRSTAAPAVPAADLEMVDHPELPGVKITVAQLRKWEVTQKFKEAHYGNK